MTRHRFPAALVAACLLGVFAFALPGPAGAAADTCRSMNGFSYEPIATAGKVVGPWPNAMSGGSSATCQSGTTFTSTAPSCLGTTESALGGQWCDGVYPAASATTTYPKKCTVRDPQLPGVRLSAIVIGWDYGGPPEGFTGSPPAPWTYTSPQGPRDGHIDTWDLLKAPTYHNEMRWTDIPFGNAYTAVPTAPKFEGQLIAYPIASSSILPASLVELQMDCV